MFDALPDDLAAALSVAADRLGGFGALRYLARVESTNDVALALASAGAPEGTSVLAGVQTKGRGRRGHDWHSPPDAGLYMSVVVRPDMSTGRPSVLTLGAGIAMADAVTNTTGLPVELKWPNDVVVGRPRRKLGGVLAETASAGTSVKAVVLGMGLNVRRVVVPAAMSARPTSIEDELGRFVDRAAVAVELLLRLREVMSWIHGGDHSRVIQRWRELAGPGLGGWVRWADARGDHRGIARDVADDGALLVVTGEAEERIVGGAVVWEEGARG